MKLKSILLLAISIFTLLSFSLLANAASDADDYSDVELRIVSKNLSYRDSIHLLVACDTDGVDSSMVELVFWSYKPTSTADAPSHVDANSTAFFDENGSVMFESVYESHGISAKDMSDEIYMAAHIKGTEIYSKIYRYSALEYLYERLTLGNPTPEQIAFYESVIAYSENAQIILKHEVENSPNDLNYVVVKGGVISDGYTAGTYLENEEITVTANNPDTFAMWTDIDGNIISSEPSFTLSPTEKSTLLIAREGFSITVKVGDTETTNTYSAGDSVSLAAPVYITEDGARKYFTAWQNSLGNTVSGTASIEITATAKETYTAIYSPITDIENATYLDYTSSPLPALSDGAHSSGVISSEFTRIYRRSKIDGSCVLIETTNKNGGEEFVNTSFESDAAATTAKFALDLLISERDLNGNGENDRGDYTSGADNTVYTLRFASGNAECSLSLELNLDGDTVSGFKVTSGEQIITSFNLDEVCSIAVEISALGNGTAYSVFVNGSRVASSFTESSYTASDGASLAIGIGKQSIGRIYIDNTVYYSAK